MKPPGIRLRNGFNINSWLKRLSKRVGLGESFHREGTQRCSCFVPSGRLALCNFCLMWDPLDILPAQPNEYGFFLGLWPGRCRAIYGSYRSPLLYLGGVVASPPFSVPLGSFPAPPNSTLVWSDLTRADVHFHPPNPPQPTRVLLCEAVER